MKLQVTSLEEYFLLPFLCLNSASSILDEIVFLSNITDPFTNWIWKPFFCYEAFAFINYILLFFLPRLSDQDFDLFRKIGPSSSFLKSFFK